MRFAINRKYYVPVNPQPLNLNTFLHTFCTKERKFGSKILIHILDSAYTKKTQTPDTQLLASSAFLPSPYIQHLRRGVECSS
ncbi:hypothetical protein CEXT_239801 [Caerostris extrusa]|uniref:Uncharacterized protein n=1 Tax=Caerostris extrusa TaxID=172846 RepID=A0AAV4S6H7_CAEEX|nr:hypothetical protein CEXT_239801 [Caerostris extrusa]